MAIKCNTNWQERKNTKIDLVGYFEKDYARVKVGDTLTFIVQIPDTVVVRRLETNTLEIIPIKTIQQADIAFRVMGIDTMNKRYKSCSLKEANIILKDKLLDYSCGVTSPNTYKKPFVASIRVVPLVKGIFVFETDVLMNGNFRFNGNIEGISTLVVGNEKRNLELLLPYFPDSVNFPSFQYGTYAFKVE